jgi:hypothetical protein
MVQLLVDALACLDPDGLGPPVLPAAECLVYLSCFSSVIVSVSKRCARLLVGAVLAPFFSEPDDILEVWHRRALDRSRKVLQLRFCREELAASGNEYKNLSCKGRFRHELRVPSCMPGLRKLSF